jgi:rubrerythrin
MTDQQESGQVTGTKDKNYNLIWYVEQCLNNVLKMEEYAGDAERDGDNDLAEFFRKAQQASQRGADQGQKLLKERLDG